MVNDKLLELQNKIKIRFDNIELLKQSLIHKSFDSKNNNEKLEFLGDRVLGLIVASMLYDNFKDSLPFSLEKASFSVLKKDFLPSNETSSSSFVLINSVRDSLARTWIEQTTGKAVSAGEGTVFSPAT